MASLASLVLAGDEAQVVERLQALERRSREAAVAAIESCESEERNGKPLLHCAAMAGRASILRHLLGFGVDANIVDDACNTPLHCAAENGHARATYLLLHSGLKGSASNAFGRTPAQLAEEQEWDKPATRDGKAFVRRMLAGSFPAYDELPPEPPGLLVEARQPLLLGSVSQRASRGKPGPVKEAANTAPREVALEGRPSAPRRPTEPVRRSAAYQSASESLAGHWRPEARTTHRRASDPGFIVSECPGPDDALASLVRTGDIGLVEAKLKELDQLGGPGAAKAEVVNCEWGDDDSRIGLSALHIAARRGNVAMLRTLLATGANPDAVNDQWNTALHLAAESGKAEAAKVLVEARADVMVRNSFGRTALDLAVVKDYDTSEVVQGKSSMACLLKISL